MLETWVTLGVGTETFGQRVRRLREEAGLTQRALANAIGVTDGAIWSWESGERTPSPENRRRLARALGVRQSVLLFGEDVGKEDHVPSIRAVLRARNQHLSESAIRSVEEFIDFVESKHRQEWEQQQREEEDAEQEG